MDFSDRVKSRMQALQMSAAELAHLVGVSKGSVTHWTNGTNQASGKRLIGLANTLKCSVVWLASGEGDPAGAEFSRKTIEGEISIPLYDMRASLEHGQIPTEYSESIRNVIVSESFLQEKGVTYSHPSHLSVVTGWDQSMKGTVNDNDPVIVDRGINEYVGDGVYLFTWAGHLFIKRLQLAGTDQLELISDNSSHKDRVVPMDEVAIHAKALLVWNVKKL